MTSFFKYNLSSSGYETFIYYDEVDRQYIQFMYAGYRGKDNEYDVLSETFHTNLYSSNEFENKYIEDERRELCENVEKTVKNIPTYIGNILLDHVYVYVYRL